MIRAIALLLTLMTGFSGLVYEIAWQRYLATLLGSHSEATSAVLGIFLGGLSVGYWLFGRVTRQIVESAAKAGTPPRLLFAYGLLEGSIGVYVILFPWLFGLVQSLSYALPHGAGGVGFVIDVGLAALLIGPASVLMGGTIPMLTQALSRSLEDATRFHAFVYAFNTAGAFAGALAAGFYLVPRLGLVNVMLTMGVINLVAGGIFLVIGWRGRAVVSFDPEESDGSPSAAENFFIYSLVALLTGFAMMALQTTIIRLAGLSFGSSQFTFSMVVAVFVLCIALGSFIVSALTQIPRVLIVLNQWALALFLLGLYTFLEDAPYWVHYLRALFRDESAAFGFYYLLGFLMVLAVVGLPVIFSGASLPLLFHQMRREVGHLGDVAGNLYSWNTVGSLLGALLGGYVLLFWIDLDQVYLVAVASLLAAALLLTIRIYRWHMATAVLVLPMLAGLLLISSWNPAKIHMGLFRSRQPIAGTFAGPEAFAALHPERVNLPILFATDDPINSVMVSENKTPFGDRAISIINNGKNDGNTFFDRMTMGLAAILPAMLADKAERAFVIGWGTGMTAGELAALSSMKVVEVAEISPGVMEAAPLFDFASVNATQNPKIRVIESDAYRALMRSDQKFDVIVSEPSNPWVTGVEMLFSREFLEVAKSRLSEGGVYAQWFHQYETDDETVALVLRTYVDVFDAVAIWSAGHQDLLLLGLDKPGAAIDHYRLEARSFETDYQEALGRFEIETFPELLAHEVVPVGVLHEADLKGSIHTLYHPLLNDQAGRAFFRGDMGRLPFTGRAELTKVAKGNSMLAGYTLRNGGTIPDVERAAMIRESFRTLGPLSETLMAEWISENPDSEIYEQTRDWMKRSLESNDMKGVSVSGEGLERAERLSLLFADVRDWSDEPVDLRTAQRAQEEYIDFYHHAAPFKPEALLQIWGRCRGDSMGYEACEELTVRKMEMGSEGSFSELMDECFESRVLTSACEEGLQSAKQLLSSQSGGF
ncbi:MAG: hypothetical protein CL917_14535 [Deltaproteobacteria bacterium]|nr:hypothetical protein [Deltaproteobacteria bacterium]